MHVAGEVDALFADLQLDDFVRVLEDTLSSLPTSPAAHASDAAALLQRMCSRGSAEICPELEALAAEMREEPRDHCDWAPRSNPPRNDTAVLQALAEGLRYAAESFFAKPHYSLGPDSAHLLMAPDLSGTLQPHQCCAGFSDGGALEQEVIATRCPLYVPSDVRKLAAIRSNAVESRMRTGGLLILSTVRSQECSEAEKMGLGDFDGDTATVFAKFVDLFPAVEPEDIAIAPPKSQRLSLSATPATFKWLPFITRGSMKLALSSSAIMRIFSRKQPPPSGCGRSRGSGAAAK